MMMILDRIKAAVLHRLALPSAADHTARLLKKDPSVRLAVDVGCGMYSPLTAHRPRITSVGLDASADALEHSRRAKSHDHYIVADVIKEDLDDILARLDGRKPDLVALYGVIEHLPKRLGFELLERCEALTSKYVLLETPNGFQPQGPEYGNPHQRHLSGWFAEDFVGLGYDVHGSTGTKYLRGYGAGPRYPWLPWSMEADHVLARAMLAHRFTRHAFNLVAIKDVRGVPARLTLPKERPYNPKGLFWERHTVHSEP